MESPSLLNTASFVSLRQAPFPPSWSSKRTEFAFSSAIVTVISGHFSPTVLIISAVWGRAPSCSARPRFYCFRQTRR
jgi:hypothetical protein